VDAAQSTGQADIPTFSTSKPARRIDAIFTDPSLPVVDYRVVDTPDTRVASDHFPLLADVGLPEVSESAQSSAATQSRPPPAAL